MWNYSYSFFFNNAFILVLISSNVSSVAESIITNFTGLLIEDSNKSFTISNKLFISVNTLSSGYSSTLKLIIRQLEGFSFRKRILSA